MRGILRYEGVATVAKNWLFDTIVDCDLKPLNYYTGMDQEDAK